MRIQIINYDGKNCLGNAITVSKISEPHSLDDFDINIIDLQNEYLWRNEHFSCESINIISDLSNVGIMLKRSSKSAAVIMFPQDYKFKYGYSTINRDYKHSIDIKNNLDKLRMNILSQLIPSETPNAYYSLTYENTITRFNEMEYKGSFYFSFDFTDELMVLIKSTSSKITAIQANPKIILTTLCIPMDEKYILTFLRKCKLISEKEDYPKWLIELNMFDDKKLNELIEDRKNIIESVKNEIDTARKKLDENMEYKSILFNNGDSLAQIVFKILEEMLSVSLSGFIDIYKEDFIIPLNDFDLIGEIKGVTSNIKSEHISQLEVHYHTYLDKLRDDGIKKEVKAILIINPLRNRPLIERTSIHEDQIKLATRNKSLVIETEKLLQVFEQFRAKKISTEKCIKMLRNEKGLLTDKKILRYLDS